MFRIYTKGGDKGKSSLADGTRVFKHHKRLETYGTCDELLSFLGVLLASLKNFELKSSTVLEGSIIRVQNQLFSLSSELAHPNYTSAQYKSFLIEEPHINTLEKEIDSWDESLESLKNFLIPGSHILSAQAHVCRSVCRRAERCVSVLSEEETIREDIIKYLNRLSDWLFMLARYLDHEVGAKENLWKSS